MAISLRGRIQDITGAPVESSSRVIVKKPIAIGIGEGVITTKPTLVDVANDGGFTLSVEPGMGWLYIEADGWSDSIPFVAAEGMTLFIEAWANATSQAVYTQIKELIAAIGGEAAALYAKQYIESASQKIISDAAAAGTEAAKTQIAAAVNDLNSVVGPMITTTGLGVTDLNTLTSTQRRRATESTELNSPNMPAPVRAIIDVIGSDDGSVVQTVTALQAPERWCRTRFANGAWSPWYSAVIKLMPSGANFDDYKAMGTYYAAAGATLNSLVNMPEVARFTLEVVGDGLNYAKQTFTNLANGAVWIRVLNAGVWGAWAKQGSGGGVAPPGGGAGLTNRLLMEDFTRRRGGRKKITTGAVAFRFDHGLKNFDALIRPLLEARNIPYALSLCSGQWSQPENEGITPAIVDEWVKGGLCEIWNHSRNHIGGTDVVAARTEIITGLEDLRAQLPSASIDGFAVPGTAGQGFGPGFIAGSDVKEFYASDGGRMILENHAVASGYIPGTHQRILDGTIRQGMLHSTLDKATLASATADIEKAKTGKTGLQLMMHPNLINTDGITTAVLTQILDLIVAERDAGRLYVASPYEMYLLDVV